MSTPSINILPVLIGVRRKRLLRILDFPAPVLPAMPICHPKLHRSVSLTPTLTCFQHVCTNYVYSLHAGFYEIFIKLLSSYLVWVSRRINSQENKLSLSIRKSHHNLYSHHAISKYRMYECPKSCFKSIKELKHLATYTRH